MQDYPSAKLRELNRISPAILARLPLSEIRKAVFFKSDEITMDLICCEVELGGTTWQFHEEAHGWDTLLNHLGQLPGFKMDWLSSVSQPPFQACVTVAFSRS